MSIMLLGIQRLFLLLLLSIVGLPEELQRGLTRMERLNI
jgi:hypothetical protein